MDNCFFFQNQFLLPSDVNLVKNLASSLQDYDALVIIATELGEINEYIDVSVAKDLQTHSQVKIINKLVL